MRLLRRLLLIAGFGLLSLSANGAPNAPVEGVEYQRLSQPQPTDTGKKVEVLEFFWYNCPHCHAFEPYLAEWAKKQGDRIVLKRIPVGFRESFAPQQKLYFALEAMNRLDLHKAVFDAIHQRRMKLNTEPEIMAFMESQNIDQKKFSETFHSFSVQSKVARVRQLQEAFRIDGVPTVAIDGQYLTSPSIIGQHMRGAPEESLNSATLTVMDALVAKKK
ncbi:MAG: thiol:disulfide interchange protein DsbA/DsbL [Betaproteobacteria bacterium]